MSDSLKMVRTNSQNPDFISLVRQLDAYLAVTDGDEHAFYDQFNKIQNIKNVIVLYENQIPVGCGAIKEFATDTMEVKRMFVKPEYRGKGIAGKILAELETWAFEMGYSKCVLETGKRQVEAVALYMKSGYRIIPNYGQYIGMDNSICFEKVLEIKAT
ncbi:GNAT family N-acetyltransferase [Aquiflexum gelatinilyticum]|uniref:GNAT family N-acetyltransferase n=1 Tax=Aquiflexum gelatinilyticum TaxID=2961943 RepID=A0A9X2SXF2_9BACT|nr:GNAT family N-acetyltransferase [Aquiflexum gelatinilyticum]MCR9013519.1 GNAT family N-acetyltransferase [Aquiflexum gelatinilyticum]